MIETTQTNDRSTDQPSWQLAAYALPFLAFAGGYFFWQGVDHYLGLAALLVGVFMLGKLPRWLAYATFFGYHLGFTTPLLTSSHLIMDVGRSLGCVLWLACGVISALPILVLHGRHAGWRAVAAFMLYLVPPLGYLAPNNPDLFMGLLFPSLGWIAIVLSATTVWSLAEIHQRPGQVIAAAMAVVSIGANIHWNMSEHRPPAHWHGFNTEFGQFALNIEGRKRIANLQLPLQVATAAAATKGDASLWFLPEGMIYDKSPVTDTTWRLLLGPLKATAVLGEFFREEQSEFMRSGVRVLGATRGDMDGLSDGRAAITFPFVMWHPWKSSDHFPMHMPNGTHFVDGKWMHLSWCSESTIAWPHIHAAFANRPEVMVTIENRWMIKGTSLENAQTAAARLNARWLGAALIQAINR